MFQAYLITCLVTGMKYVGVTSRSLRQRWNEHLYDARNRHAKMVVSRAIAKYGPENFCIEAICSARSWADICTVEAVLIKQHGTRVPHGYNLSDGGDGAFGVKKSAESVERSASKHRGKSCHPNTRAAAIRTHKGKPKSAETRAKIAAAKKGKLRSDATKEKLRVYWAARRLCGQFKTLRPYDHHARAST